MKVTDKLLLEIYNKGWQEENDIYTNKIKATEYDITILQTAYDLGRYHFLLGDDNTKYDLLTNEEILKIIKYES